MEAMITNDDGCDELQRHHNHGEMEQQHRCIWGRLAIAEIPYPVIEADDVVVSLYANRLLLRVAPSAFTVTVFFRDISRIVFLSEEKSIEMHVARSNGAHRTYIMSFQEPRVALMLYDVMLPLLPDEVKDTSLGRVMTPFVYITDPPFSLLSPSMMAELGFYELRRPRGSLVGDAHPNERGISSRFSSSSGQQFPLFFQHSVQPSTEPWRQKKEREELDSKMLFPQRRSFLAPLPSRKNSQVPPTDAFASSAASCVIVPPRCEPPCLVESVPRNTGSFRMETLPGQGVFSEVKKGKSLGEPCIVTYDVVTGRPIHKGECARLSDTSFSWRRGMLVESVTPVSQYPSLSRSPCNNPVARQADEVGSREQLDVTPPGAFRIGAGASVSVSRSGSMRSHCTDTEASSLPIHLPRQSPSLVFCGKEIFRAKRRPGFPEEL